MSKAGFGTPKIGGGNNYKKTGGPQAGDTFIRLMPPMFSLADAGEWKVYWSTHWGYSGVNSQDASKTTMRPFRCIQDMDFRTKLIRQECPACTLYEQYAAQAKEEEAALRAEGKSDDEIETEMASINEWLKAHRIERKYYVNVMYKDGTFGDFKLNHKHHWAQLKGFIEGTKEKRPLTETDGIDPIALDQGVWFKITRTGKGFDTPDIVNVEMADVEAEVNGRKKMVKEIVPAPISDEQCDKALKECRDLNTLGGLSVTFDQIQELVSCSGDPAEVDRILGVKTEEKTKAAPAKVTPPAAKVATPAVKATPAAKPAVAAAKPAVSKPAVAAASKPAAAAAPAGKPPMSDAMKAKVAEVLAKKAAAEAAAKAAEEAAALAAEELAAEAGQEVVEASGAAKDPSDMTDEEVLQFLQDNEKAA